MKLILYYDGHDEKKRRVLQHYCEAASLPFRVVDPIDQNQTIGELLKGLPSSEPVQNDLPDKDLLICNQINDKEISKLLGHMRKEGMKMERTCVVTQYNITWKLVDLLHEIIEEHEMMDLRSACQKEIKEISVLQEERYTPQSWALYQDAVLKGFILLQQGRLRQEQLRSIIHEIQERKALLKQVES